MSRAPKLFERLPPLTLPSLDKAEFRLETCTGRNLILVFPGSPASPALEAFMTELGSVRSAFDDVLASLFFIVSSPDHVDAFGIAEEMPGIRYLMDYDGAAARSHGLVAGADRTVAPRIFVLDRNYRLLQMLDFVECKPYLASIVSGLRSLASYQAAQGSINHAPVLVMERIFEPALCRRLIDYYRLRGGHDSGFMTQRDGFTVGLIDHCFKRRRDCLIDDPILRDAAMHRVHDRLAPEIERAFQFEATRIERHLVACYDAGAGGYFRPHRDNSTMGTAHRRFAVTINLNADYEGGDLRFPEFGDRLYRAPAGGAVVFSCTLLHEATAVTKGVRYAYLPFLYGAADAELRERNRDFVEARSGGRAQPSS
jgi:hypothetical protein